MKNFSTKIIITLRILIICYILLIQSGAALSDSKTIEKLESWVQESIKGYSITAITGDKNLLVISLQNRDCNNWMSNIPDNIRIFDTRKLKMYSLTVKAARPIMEIHLDDNSLYMSSRKAELLIYDLKAEKYVEFDSPPFDPLNVDPHRMVSICSDKNSLWILTATNGLYCFEKKNKKWSHFPTKAYYCNDIVSDGRFVVWGRGCEFVHGTEMFDIEKQHFDGISPMGPDYTGDDDDFISSNPVIHNNEIWFKASQNSYPLYKMNISTKRWTHFDVGGTPFRHKKNLYLINKNYLFEYDGESGKWNEKNEVGNTFKDSVGWLYRVCVIGDIAWIKSHYTVYAISLE
ncbi:hypothetical protein K8T06_06585 [bacterium]|nr:hypothetical protein [bacterium]